MERIKRIDEKLMSWFTARPYGYKLDRKKHSRLIVISMILAIFMTIDDIRLELSQCLVHLAMLSFRFLRVAIVVALACLRRDGGWQRRAHNNQVT